MTEAKRPLKVFLCHASTDKPKVRELYRYLRRRGINPWFDEEDLVGGQDWQVEIPKALATSDAIIICLTKNSVDKEGYIQKEIKFALDKALEMPEGRIFLIPVKFEECEVPFALSRYQWVDLTVESGYAKMMKALKFRASQLERSTVEVSKKNVEEEIAAREAAKKVVREKAEKDAIEKARLEAEEQAKIKAAKEKEEREAVERAERKRKEKELREKQVREAREKEKYVSEKKEEKPAIIKPKAGGQIAYWFVGFIILILGIVFLSSLNSPSSTPQPTPENTQTQVSVTSPQNTVEPSVTTTPKATSTPSVTLTPTPLPNEITDAKGVPMVLIPDGEFTMGDSREGVQQIHLDDFYIDKYEVTNIHYAGCVDVGDCIAPKQISSYTRSNYYGNSEFENYPVVNIDWNQAKIYCEWRGGNLPTEAQWEKSARGIDERRYPWGDEISCAKANYSNCIVDTVAVGSYESGKSPYGVYDLAGNVWEWVDGWYNDDDTIGVLRGGTWSSVANYVRTSMRYPGYHNTFDYRVGFRCAMDAIP